jgi:predicted DNA binding CopG/RHH family protein
MKSKEEKELMKSIENNEWKPAKDSRELKKQLMTAAKKTMAKDKRMNIRIAGRDLESLKIKALEEGMPYQTLVSSILHKYVTGQLTNK